MMFEKILDSGINCMIIITSLILIGLSNGGTIDGSIEANLELNVEGNGFHRMFIYQINFINFEKDNCHIGLILNIPSTLYVNIDDLADLERHGNVTACSLGETNVEIFAENAKPQELTVCSRLKNSNNVLSFKLHQRYQRARNNENYVNVTVPNPKVILGCKERIKQYPVSKIDICESCAKLTYKWREIPYKMKTKPHVWIIPVGELSQKNVVTWITLFACALGSIYTVKIIRQSF